MGKKWSHVTIFTLIELELTSNRTPANTLLLPTQSSELPPTQPRYPAALRDFGRHADIEHVCDFA
jgi:hypothetical protein